MIEKTISYQVLLRQVFLLIIFTIGSLQLFAQFPTNTGGFNNRSSNNLVDTAQGDVVLDTFKIFLFQAKSFYREKPFQDSLLNNYTHQLDPARNRRFDYQNLGVDGSAAMPIVFETQPRMGFDVGLNQFDLYRIKADSFNFYRVEKAFTNAEYDRGADQTNSNLKLQFARNFAKGVSLSINYKRNSQLGDRVQLPHQQTRNTAFGVGLSLGSQTGTYKGFFTFLTNKTEQEDNGGITFEPILQGQFSTASSGSVQTQTANSTYRWNTYQYTHYYDLRAAAQAKTNAPQKPQRPPLRPGGRSPVDSLSTDTLIRSRVRVDSSFRAAPRPNNKNSVFNKQAFLIRHTIAYKKAIYKFAEESPDPTTLLYQSFYTDSRGLRHFIEHNTLENEFSLLTYKPETRASNLPKGSRGLLELGLQHRLHFVAQEPLDYKVNNLFLKGRWHYLPTPFLKLETYGHLGILDNIGDFRAEGKITFDFGKLGQLEGLFSNQLSEPYLINRRLYISEQNIWENALNKTLESTLQATYRLPARRFSVTGAYHLIDNLVYFDQQAQTQQSNSAVSVLQLMVSKQFSLGKFHLDNEIVIQNSSADILRLPSLFGKHNLYYQGRWFRKILDTRIGVDLRYTSAYFANTYNPLVGSFHLQDRQELNLLPLVDVHLSFRVDKFRAYAKLENIRNLLIENPTDAEGTVLDRSDVNNWQLIYPTPFYPYVNASGFRLGIKWKFTD